MNFMHDTDIETKRKYIALLRKMPGEKRLEQGLRMSALARETSLAAIAKQYPEFTQKEVQLEYFRRVLSREEFARIFGKER